MLRAGQLSRAARQCRVALLALAVAARAAAQTSAPAEPAGAADSAPALERTEQASRHYAQALEYYDAGAHAQALHEFRSAYALMREPRLLFNIGQLEFSLQRYAEARRSLQQYLREGGERITPERRADVLRQLAELETLAGEELAREALAAEQPAPRAPRSEPHASIAPGRQPAAPPHASAAWISSGVLGLGALGTAVATVLASRRHSELRSERTTPAGAASARARLDRQRERVQQLSLATDVLALAALGSAGLGLYLTLSSEGAEPSQISVGLSAGEVSVTGSF